MTKKAWEELVLQAFFIILLDENKSRAAACYIRYRFMPSVLELYEKLKPKLGEEEARSLLEYVETSVEQRAATKADLQEAVAGLREEIHREIDRVRDDMQAMKAELIKWPFAFSIGTVAALSGIMFALLRTAEPR